MKSNAPVVSASIVLACCVLLSLWCSTVRAADPVGAWHEIEQGVWHTSAKDHADASGGKAVSWFNAGKAVYVPLTLEQAMPNARLYVRYSRGGKAPVELKVSVAPLPQKGNPKKWTDIGNLPLKPVKNGDFGWTSMPLGSLEAGNWAVMFNYAGPGEAGELDYLGVIDDRFDGLWLPANDVRDKKLVGEGSVAVRLTALATRAGANLIMGEGDDAQRSIEVGLWNHTEAATAELTVSCRGEGQALTVEPVKVTLKPDERKTVSLVLPRGIAAGTMPLQVEVKGDAGVAIDISKSMEVRLVESMPVWIEGRRFKRNDRAGARGDSLFYGWEPKAGDIVAGGFTLEKDQPAASVWVLYRRNDYRTWKGPVTTDVYLGPTSAKLPTDEGMRRIGDFRQEVTGKTSVWKSVFAGDLKAGAYRIMLVDRDDFGGDVLQMVGIVGPIERGLWMPPKQTADGRPVGAGEIRTAAVEVIGTITSEHVGNLLPAGKYLGPQGVPATFKVTLRNHVVTKSAEATVSARLLDDRGPVADVDAQRVTLGPGESRDVPVAVKVADHGWYRLEISAVAGGESKPLETTFCVIRPAHAGLKPQSMFGMNIFVGAGSVDLDWAPAIGVKWRRGVPGVEPDLVHPKPGEFWNDEQINKVRDTIAKWQQAGIMLLGDIEYNMSWNVEPDPLGRPIQRHQNRPKDLAAQAEMVFHTIKPLVDLVPHWEIWNEPWVHEWTWRTGTAQDYRDMARLIWDRVKTEVPGAQLIGGGSTPYQRDILFVPDAPNAGYVDGVASHPYGIPEGTTAAYAALDAEMLRRHAKGGKAGIWVTEMGTSEFVHHKDRGPLDGRLMVARAVAPLHLLLKLGAGETPVHCFWFAAGYNRSFSGDFLNIWDRSVPKPVVAAYSAMTHVLEDAAFQGDIYQDSRAYWAAHLIRPDGTQIAAVWPQDQEGGTATINAAGIEAYDYMGRAVPATDGRLVLPMRQWQVHYLISSLPREKFIAALRSAKFDGVEALAVNPRSFTEPLATRPTLRVRVENLLPVPTPAKLELTQLPSSINIANRQVDLGTLAPGEVRIVEFALADATPHEANRYPIHWSVTTAVGQQTGVQVVQVAAATRGKATVDGDLSEWKDAVPVTLFSGGVKDDARILLNPDMTAELLNNPGTGGTGIYRLWMRWDDEALYIAADVPDNNMRTNSTFADDPYAFPFWADCLQLAFNVTPENPDDLLAGHPLYEKAMGTDVDYEFVATLAQDRQNGPTFGGKPPWKGDVSKLPASAELHRLRAPGTNHQTFYPTNPPTNPPLGPINGDQPGQAKCAIVYDAAAKAYRYEMAIPWSMIPHLGQQLAQLKDKQALRSNFAFSVSDPGGRWRSFWTQEAGDVRSGAYGFTPAWEGGRSAYGGRVVTDWGFVR